MSETTDMTTKTMSPEAQRIAIAETVGTLDVWVNNETSVPLFCLMPKGHKPYSDARQARYWTQSTLADLNMAKSVANSHLLPNYLSDLNAIHKAENMFHSDHLQAEKYAYELERVVFRVKHSGTGIAFQKLNATAAQRAEAFLRTIGKWEGE